MIVDIFLLLLTALLVALTIWLWCQSPYRAFMYDSTVGCVTGYRREDGCYVAEIRFVTAVGETIEAVSDAPRGVKEWQSGEEVRVLYNRRNPRKAIIRSVSSL